MPAESAAARLAAAARRAELAPVARDIADALWLAAQTSGAGDLAEAAPPDQTVEQPAVDEPIIAEAAPGRLPTRPEPEPVVGDGATGTVADTTETGEADT